MEKGLENMDQQVRNEDKNIWEGMEPKKLVLLTEPTTANELMDLSLLYWPLSCKQ